MAKYDDEEVTCPVCGNPVGLEVPSCPHCGAEFENEEDVEGEPAPEPAPAPTWTRQAASEDEEEIACPVCGRNVGLSITTCPNCGAEFEEEEVEEIIEVEEEPAEEAEVEFEAEESEEEEVGAQPIAASILDMKVIGVALIALGIIGSQISFMIDWYWTWVPPIGDNLVMYIAIPAAILVVGLVVWLAVKKVAAGGRKRLPSFVPTMALTLFLFGIFALIMMLLWDQINTALQDSQLMVAGAFVLVVVVGVGLMFMGSRTPARTSCD